MNDDTTLYLIMPNGIQPVSRSITFQGIVALPKSAENVEALVVFASFLAYVTLVSLWPLSPLCFLSPLCSLSPCGPCRQSLRVPCCLPCPISPSCYDYYTKAAWSFNDFALF